MPESAWQERTWRILIVDDNKEAARMLGMLLQLDGHTTREVFDGAGALQAVSEYQPEIVLLDIGLPDMSGLDVCREIRASEADKKIYVIALTGLGDQDDRRKTEEAGFDKHLVKPLEHNDLLKILSRIPV